MTTCRGSVIRVTSLGYVGIEREKERERDR